MKRFRISARNCAYRHALLWVTVAGVLLVTMLGISDIHPFRPIASFVHTTALCLLGAASVGSSLMISGWLCTAARIMDLCDKRLEQIYGTCTPDDLALRQYNVWRFQFFGMKRYFDTDESHIIQRLEEGCQPKDLFPH